MTALEVPRLENEVLGSLANADQSDLDSARYGYDLVCATTQDSINATMKEYLAGFQGTEFTACYTFDPATGKKILTPLSDIVAAIGGDPFSIPNNSTDSNPMVQKLYNACKFEFAFRAKMGLPAGVAPAQQPDVVVLNKGNSSVSYQLYCSEFSVLMLEQNFGALQFTNLQQPANDPWLFLFEVNLDMRAGDINAFNNLPPAVQNRVKNLNPDSAFSVQQLLLDLTTAGLQSMPTIKGLDPTSDAYVYLTRTFINEYWANLGSSGILLGYAVLPTIPNANPSSPSVIPTDLNIEVSPYVDGNGNPTTQYGLYTLNYLVMSQNRPMPAPVPFSWNWVEASEEADFDGTMAVRRSVFATFLQNLIQPYSATLSIDTTVSMTHDGEDFYTTLSAPWSPNPAQWAITAPGTAAGPDGFTPIMTIGYSHNSYDSSEDALHLSSINGTFNYAMNGDVSASGNVLRLQLHTTAYIEFNAHIVGINAANFSGNIVDYATAVTYTLGVDQNGQLTVTEGNASITDNSQDIDVSTWDSMIGLGDIASMIRSMRTQLSAAVASSTQNYESTIAYLLNGSGAWVYPGGKTFVFKEASFSDNQDLLTHVTYADPTQHAEALVRGAARKARRRAIKVVHS
ncbi:MAG TPA: hypothetical protein VJ901_13810 [Thermoanaerobaculia bacterium]|nr:hypothetical protein [Thermoanaerobaculia bacterium]